MKKNIKFGIAAPLPGQSVENLIKFTSSAEKLGFDVKENHKGKYLRITELSGGRSCIVIPLGGIKIFKDRLGEIIDETDQLVGLE